MHTAHSGKFQRSGVDARLQADIVDAQADRAGRDAATGRSGRRWQRGSLAWFVVVGCGAAALHWCVAIGLVGRCGWPPLLANAAGWALAFALSLAGHHRMTFRDHGTPLSTAALRHFCVSAAGFGINEAAYAMLLQWQPAHYGVALAVVLALVAGLTYLVSRHWTFLRTAER